MLPPEMIHTKLKEESYKKNQSLKPTQFNVSLRTSLTMFGMREMEGRPLHGRIALPSKNMDGANEKT